MSLLPEDAEVLEAFELAPLNRGMHAVPTVVRAMGGDVTNPSRRAAVEASLRRLVRSGRVMATPKIDGLTYYARQRASADRTKLFTHPLSSTR